MAHDHSHVPKVRMGRATRLALVGFLALTAVVTLVALAVLWPNAQAAEDVRARTTNMLAQSYTPPVEARITGVLGTCPAVPEEPTSVEGTCELVDAVLTTGSASGQTVQAEIWGVAARSGLRAGDNIYLAETATPDGAITYTHVGTARLPAIAWLTGLFVVAVLVIARLRGLLALIGLVFSGWVFMQFMVPALITGAPAILVALTGSTAIMFVVLYATHGVSMRTSAAFAGTLLSLLFTTLLGVVAVDAARLSGIADDAAIGLSGIVGELNFSDLFAVSIIVAGLGVLNDVTITQASAAWELRAASPTMSRRQIFASGMRIGRDHIASTIYTIVFAYAGATLALLMLLFFYDRPLLELLATEEFGGEVVRTLATATGLVLSVPITTAIAAITLAPAVDGHGHEDAVPGAPRRAIT